MIQKILINELEDLVATRFIERKKLREKARDLRKKLNNKSEEYKKAIDEIKSQMPPGIFLEEDISGVKSGGFKRGKELEPEDIRKIKDLGYQIIWINDGSELEQATNDYKFWDHDFHELKTEIENILIKTMHPFEENEVRKPGSTIKIFDGDDLIKQNINPLHSDGAKIIFSQNFGEGAKKVLPLHTLTKTLLKKCKKTGLFENISIGNLYKAQDSEQVKRSEPTNFFLKNCLNTGLAFAILLKKIQTLRIPEGEEPPTHLRDIDPQKRHAYMEEQVLEATRAAYYVDYGYLHGLLFRMIYRITKPLIDPNGQMVDKGYIPLEDRVKNIFEHHCNVSKHILASQRNPTYIKEDGHELLQYHHRGLHGGGYPKRKMEDERISEEDMAGNVQSRVQSMYEHTITELTRLAGIINTFCEYLFGTPWRLPFQRDSLVRYFLINRVYPKNQDGEDDISGTWDVNTRLKHKRRFDAYLVDLFFEHIYLFKIEEVVPIYKFSDPTTILYHAVVIRHNKMPHRPVVLITDEDGTDKEMDLSQSQYNHYYIGEYHPCLKFKIVQEEIAPEFSLDGLIMPEDEEVQSSLELNVGGKKTTSNDEDEKLADLKRNAEVDKVFADDDMEDFQPKSKSNKDFDLDNFLAEIGESGGKESEEQSTNPAQEAGDIQPPSESTSSTESQPAKSHPAEYNPLPENTISFEGEDIELMEYGPSDIVYLNYVEELDPKKNPNPPSNAYELRGSPKYICKIEKVEDGKKPIVQFLRFVKKNNGDYVYVKDKYSGQHVDLNKYPFFKVDRMLTARELVNALSIEL